jgi:hypothetical protein
VLFSSVFCLFVCYIIVGFLFLFLFLFSFFLSVLSTSPSLSSHPYSHPVTLLPSPVLESIALLPKYSFCPFLFTLSPCLHLSLSSSLNLSPHYTSLLHTHHLLTNLLYQLYTTPTPCNPLHRHPTLQQQKYPQTHTRATKPSSPTLLLPLTHPTSHLLF